MTSPLDQQILRRPVFVPPFTADYCRFVRNPTRIDGKYGDHFLQADFWTGTSSGLHRDLTETGAYDAHGRRNSQVRISGQWTMPHWEAKAEMPRRYILDEWSTVLGNCFSVLVL